MEVDKEVEDEDVRVFKKGCTGVDAVCVKWHRHKF